MDVLQQMPSEMYELIGKRVMEQKLGPPTVIMSKESILKVENGLTFIRPPRRTHRNVVVRLLDSITRWIDPQA